MLNPARALPAADHRIGSLVVGPSDSNWDEARSPWNLAKDQQPAFVAFPESADDVVAIVEHARANGLRVAPRAPATAARSVTSPTASCSAPRA